MFDKLLSLFENNKLQNVANIAGFCSQIVKQFEADLVKGDDTRNAVIDCIISILQAEKK